MDNFDSDSNKNETRRRFDFALVVYQRLTSYFPNQTLSGQHIEHRTLRSYVCRVFRISKQNCQQLFLEMDQRGLLHLNNRGIVILKNQEAIS